MALSKTAIQRMFQELSQMEQRLQAAQDPKGGGWRLYVQARQGVEFLREQLPTTDAALGPTVARAIEVLQDRIHRMDERQTYNPVTVMLHERSEDDLVALKGLVASEDYEQRLAAVAAVDELRWSDALPLLQDRLEVEDHPFVISKLTKVVGHIGGRVALKQLVPFLEHEDARIRANTVEGMADIPGDEKYKYLVPLIEDPSPRVQGNVAVSLQGMGAQEFAGLVARMVHSPEAGARRSALYVLGQLPPSATFAHLRDLTHDDEADIRRLAVAALGKLDTLAAAEALVDVLRAYPEGDTHAAARAALEAIWHGRPEAERKDLVDALGEFAGEVARAQHVAPTPPADSVETLIEDLTEPPA